MITALFVVLQMLVGAVVALTLRLLLEDKITSVLSRIMGGLAPKSSRRITGLWYSVFWYNGVDGTVKRRTHLLSFRSVGSRVTATTVTGPGTVYRLSAKVNSGSYLTGTWENATSDNLYHGACQFVIQPEGELLVGRWIGWNKRHTVGCGPWILVRASRDLSKNAVSEMCNRLARGSEPVWDGAIENQIQEIAKSELKGDAIALWRDARNLAPNSPPKLPGATPAT